MAMQNNLKELKSTDDLTKLRQQSVAGGDLLIVSANSERNLNAQLLELEKLYKKFDKNAYQIAFIDRNRGGSVGDLLKNLQMKKDKLGKMYSSFVVVRVRDGQVRKAVSEANGTVSYKSMWDLIGELMD